MRGKYLLDGPGATLHYQADSQQVGRQPDGQTDTALALVQECSTARYGLPKTPEAHEIEPPPAILFRQDDPGRPNML